MKMASIAQAHGSRCHLCTEDGVQPLVDLGAHPIAHRLLEAPDEPEYRHSVRLGVCRRCGLIQLVDPIPASELYSRYNWLSAWKPNPHVPMLLSLVSGVPGLTTNAMVLEIGSNDGSFLAELRERGFANILGIEPAEDAYLAATARGVPTRRGYFDANAASALLAERGPVDLLICRQVLEHVVDLSDMAEAIACVLRPGGAALLEVPDFELALKAPDYSAIWEEHVNYFTEETLTAFLTRAGLQVVHKGTVEFSGRALYMLAQRTTDNPERLGPPCDCAVVERARRYAAGWDAFRTRFREALSLERDRGARVALYGAGARSCSLVNFADVGNLIAFAIDDQPEKQGRFMPGSHLEIRPSTALLSGNVDLCLLAVNAENEERVLARHERYTARGGRFFSVHPPSARLHPLWSELSQSDSVTSSSSVVPS